MAQYSNPYGNYDSNWAGGDFAGLNSDALQFGADPYLNAATFNGSGIFNNSGIFNGCIPTSSSSNSQIRADLIALQLRTNDLSRRVEFANAALAYFRRFIASGGTITPSQRARIVPLLNAARNNATFADRFQARVDFDFNRILAILNEGNTCPCPTPSPLPSPCPIPSPLPVFPSNSCGCSGTPTIGSTFRGY
jgi:hypothetical protein